MPAFLPAMLWMVTAMASWNACELLMESHGNRHTAGLSGPAAGNDSAEKRRIEILDFLKFKLVLHPDIPLKTQERSYTTPICYTPKS